MPTLEFEKTNQKLDVLAKKLDGDAATGNTSEAEKGSRRSYSEGQGSAGPGRLATIGQAAK